MTRFFRGIIRASSFLRKEIFEILRQPRLIASLVLGPFLILFIFGIGYRSQSRPLSSLFVTQPDTTITAQDVQEYGKKIGSVLIFSGVTSNLTDALGQLRRGKVDLVIALPGDTANIIKNNKQAVFTLYHHEIDPVQVNYVEYLGWLYVGAINQQVLYSFVAQEQKDTVHLQSLLQEAHQNLSAVRQALQSGDAALGKQKQQAFVDNLSVVSQTVGVSLGLLDGLQQKNGTDGENKNLSQNALADLRENANQLGSDAGTREERLASLDKIDKDLADLEGKLVTFHSVDTEIITSPFRSDIKNVAPVQPSNSDFFAPAVLALLLQHLAVTFAALSFVRERNAGTLELFRVSPLSAAEALFGKYISYMVFGSVISAILSVLLVFSLHMPMLGNWWNFALVIGGVLFTSLGFGFIISIFSQTDSQAVQYSMIMLLASVFFSGFIVSLEMLWEPVRVFSWLLPTTYGALLLRVIALRGEDPNWTILAGLFAIGLVLMLISWRLIHRLIVSPR